ncbi:MAG: OmpH family outer membrane protein [Paracoccaceae bacterium]
MPRTAATLAILAWLLPVAALAQDPKVLVVSRERVLRETAAAEALREAERARSAEFQARLDALKTQLEAEETELARLRRTLPRDDFEERTQAFDRKVRAARRRSQEQAARLQQTFRAARERLNAEMVPVLVEVLRARGADLIVDSAQVLVAQPAINVTEEVIRRFDARIERIEIELPPAEPFLPEQDRSPDPPD